jgi:translocation and assembly module TamA
LINRILLQQVCCKYLARALVIAAFTSFINTSIAGQGEPVDYKNVSTIKFVGVNNERLLGNILSSVELNQRIKDKSAWASTELYERQRLVSNATKQVLDALKPYGFYGASVEEKVLDNGARLEYRVTLGQAVIVDDVLLKVSGAAENQVEIDRWLKSFPLAKGAVLIQPDYDAAKFSLNQILRRFGYFDARFLKQEVVINFERSRADISLLVESGPRYRYGELSIEWRNDEAKNLYSDKFLSRYLTLKQGDAFDSGDLQKVQSELSNSAYFAFVELRPQFDTADHGTIPIKVILETPKRLAYGGSVGFGTDSGPRAGVQFENRRVNTLGHRFNSEVNSSTEKQSLLANYSLPSNGSKRDGVNLLGSFINEDSDARDSSVWLVGFDFNRSLSEQTQLSYGVSYRDERFIKSFVQQESQLLLPTVSWQTVSADDLRNPNRGYRFSASLRGADDNLGSDISFAQLNLNAKSVFSFGKGRLIGRAQVGQTFIRNGDSLPSSLNYFTGGDHSVRGYGFESIGVADENGILIGGENLVAASIEYEHALKGLFALAAFVDAGDAYDDKFDLKLGVGVGVRWRLPFGAIRLDIASAQDLDGKPVRLHFTIGTDL